MEILHQSVLTSALDLIEWLASHIGSCTLRKDIWYTLNMELSVQHFRYLRFGEGRFAMTGTELNFFLTVMSETKGFFTPNEKRFAV